MAWRFLEDGTRVEVCNKCESIDCFTRHSMGIYAGVYCDHCWKNSGYRDVGPEEFDSSYAGERYEEDY